MLPLLQSLLDSRAQAAAKGQSDLHADLLRMTRESMNGSFTAKLASGEVDSYLDQAADRVSIVCALKARQNEVEIDESEQCRVCALVTRQINEETAHL